MTQPPGLCTAVFSAWSVFPPRVHLASYQPSFEFLFSGYLLHETLPDVELPPLSHQQIGPSLPLLLHICTLEGSVGTTCAEITHWFTDCEYGCHFISRYRLAHSLERSKCLMREEMGDILILSTTRNRNHTKKKV